MELALSIRNVNRVKTMPCNLRQPVPKWLQIHLHNQALNGANFNAEVFRHRASDGDLFLQMKTCCHLLDMFFNLVYSARRPGRSDVLKIYSSPNPLVRGVIPARRRRL
jgi:hypothetical protein